VLGVQFGFWKLDDSSSIVERLARELELPPSSSSSIWIGPAR
jgi:hypothetical protein